jgi:hypothetical protein
MEKDTRNDKIFQPILNIFLKGVILFLIFNFILALIPKGGIMGGLSWYNTVFPGRLRLPFGETPRIAYNLSLYDIEAMFSSHEIDAGKKPDNEFRVLLIGDSSAWGILLRPEETLSGLINGDNLRSCDGRIVKSYNLAYPSMSLLKDLMIIERALSYEPDLIIWPVTLQAFPDKHQISTPLVANNPHFVQPLIAKYDLSVTEYARDFNIPSYWDLTLIGRRRNILDFFQLQFYGVMWSATHIDQHYPASYTPAQLDFEIDDTQFAGWDSPKLPLEHLSMDIIQAAHDLAGEIPILLINEPILISQGENHETRYNYYYPRWAYDQYRIHLEEWATQAKWHYIDLWDVVPYDQFTNSPVHQTTEGMLMYYAQLLPALKAEVCP